VEQLVDEWLDAHPEAPRLPHLEETDESSPVASSAAEASASVGATDVGALTPESAAAGGA
jgi:hypothetical protein